MHGRVPSADHHVVADRRKNHLQGRMMPTAVTARERDLYEEMWQHDAYGESSPGVRAMPIFLDMVKEHLDIDVRMASVLDAGCGSGRGSIALADAGFYVTACDLVDARVPEARNFRFVRANIWDRLYGHVGFHDLVFCADVLEHIPTEFVGLVLEQLLGTARKGVFLQIAFGPDQFGALVGRPLHQSVFPFAWWRDRLRELGAVVDARDLVGCGVFFVRPRLQGQRGESS
jgi:SAM-dependent methyltransferase